MDSIKEEISPEETASKPDQDECQIIELEQEVTGDRVEALADKLLSHRHQDLLISAKDLIKVDTTGIEVLVSAARLWKTDQRAISYEDLSDPFKSSLELLGISVSNLEVMEEQ